MRTLARVGRCIAEAQARKTGAVPSRKREVGDGWGMIGAAAVVVEEEEDGRGGAVAVVVVDVAAVVPAAADEDEA